MEHQQQIKLIKFGNLRTNEEILPKDENPNMCYENLSRVENIIKANLPTHENPSKDGNETVSKDENMGQDSDVAVSKNNNFDKIHDDNASKNENLIKDNEESVSRDSINKSAIKIKNENADTDIQKMANSENFSMNKGSVSKDKITNIQMEEVSEDKCTEMEKTVKNKNLIVKEENVLMDKNVTIIDKNKSKSGNSNSEEKPKSRNDEEKESAATLLTDTLRACISPKSSDSGTVSVPLPPPEDTSSTVSNSSIDDANDRGTWSRQLDFFLSCVGYAVGLGNIWRFPYLCYRSGGGAFLIPYLIFLIICGMPLFFLEMSFGQFASLGPIAIWKICPLFKGLGYGMTIISVVVCIYYNVIIAWTLYYIYLSISIPWKTCSNYWNTENCIDSSEFGTSSSSNCSNSFNETYFANCSVPHATSDKMLNTTMASEEHSNRSTSSQEFWLRYVLHQSSGIDDIGELQMPLVLTLFLAWVVVFLCLQKGVKSSGKVVYFSATFPYVILVILLIRGLTLPGAWNGIRFYLTPRWELLMSFEVWADAATQIFYSVGAAWGAVLTMASYNKFNSNVYRYSLLVPAINCATSFFAGFVVFAILGFMSYETGKPIDKVVSQGPGLAFIAYPEAVARLPFPQVWSILFFIMLFTIGLDSQFGMFETAVSAFVDEFPNLLQKRKTLFTAFLCFILFILGLPCVTEGGIYILQLMDWYSATFSLMIVSLLETIVISYIYGINRFLHDISLMIKRTPPLWWKLCWCFITPGTIIFLLIFIFINHTPVSYENYVYPGWSIVIGWLIAVCSIIPIPLVAAVQFSKADGTFIERLRSCVTPTSEWGPALEENRIAYKKSLSVVAPNFPQKHFSGLANSSSTTHVGEESAICMVQRDQHSNPESSV